MKKLRIAFLSLITLAILSANTTGHLKKMKYTLNEEQSDGPYVQYKGDEVYANYIMESNGTKTVKTDSVELNQKTNLSLNVLTDIPGKPFTVHLKKKLKDEKCEFRKVKKILALSDIEGNFAAFRILLQGNNVIDENFNWTFGDGSLVLIGDFFDRGQNVPEVLWLIYSLEEKAKDAGGYVHFILGNHEIMNLTGDLRYTPKKYIDNAGLLDENYVELYGENSELGRWLRTKNIVEKIGKLLFVHGGLSGYINTMNVSVTDINRLARPYYADTTYNYVDNRSDLLMGNLGPFWYRGYYDKNNPNVSLQIDSTLRQFWSDHIITGHTIVADTISVWYKGKLLNTDVHHASGKSEALLIEDNKYYRVDGKGNKVLLIEDK